MSIKLAVFDMAGTTVADDDFVAKAFLKAFALKGIPVSLEEINPMMGYHKLLAIKTILEKTGAAAENETIKEIHKAFVEEMVAFYADAVEVRPMEHVEDVFLALKEKGILIALNTGFSREIADVIIKRFKWWEIGLIDDVIASDEVEKGRPYPFMINQLMLRAGVTSGDDVAKIGDTIVDIEEGRNSGCKYVIAVTSGSCSREALLVYQPTHIIDSILEVPSLLQ